MRGSESARRVARARSWRALAAAALLAAGCSSGGGHFATGGYLTGRNYSYAVYDSTDELLHTPIDGLRREIADRARDQQPPITDVFVLAHGWNFTVEESFALYEGYRHSLEPMLDKLRAQDPHFEPYFIFVVWSSVSRPVTDAMRSVLPWTPPDWIDATTHAVDTVAFHLPSSWGESQDAARIALGPSDRWKEYRPRSDPAAPTEYAKQIGDGLSRAEKHGFSGFDASLSVLLGELMRIRGSDDPGGRPGPRLHVVGHSFGGKLASLATCDAVTRAIADELARPQAAGAPPPSETLVDSLILILPAMQISEMYWELPLELDDAQRKLACERGLLRESALIHADVLRFEAVARRIGTKALVYSRDDSANGWVFAIGDLILDHDSISAAQQEVIHWRPLDRLIYGDEDRPAWGKVVASPFALVYGTVQLLGKAVYGVAGTAFSDVSALVDGPIAQCRAIGEDWPDALDVAGDILLLPVSPLTVQRSTGNQGMRHVRTSVSLLDPSTWLDGATVDYLKASEHVSSKRFLELTSAPGVPLGASDGHYAVCDARLVYDGALATYPWIVGQTLNFIPPGAHGDVRSMDRVEDPKNPDGLEKRLRTFLFVYNATRSARP